MNDRDEDGGAKRPDVSAPAAPQRRQKSLAEWLVEKRDEPSEVPRPDKSPSGIVQLIGELGKPRE